MFVLMIDVASIALSLFNHFSSVFVRALILALASDYYHILYIDTIKASQSLSHVPNHPPFVTDGVSKESVGAPIAVAKWRRLHHHHHHDHDRHRHHHHHLRSGFVLSFSLKTKKSSGVVVINPTLSMLSSLTGYMK